MAVVRTFTYMFHQGYTLDLGSTDSLLLCEVERRRVDAVSESRGSWSIREDMSKVSIALGRRQD